MKNICDELKQYASEMLFSDEAFLSDLNNIIENQEIKKLLNKLENKLFNYTDDLVAKFREEAIDNISEKVSELKKETLNDLTRDGQK